ncbi:MAG: DUF4974 domain-containing protein [Bacteroidetes bacterium]|nr:MAG: DUF4974 domain-containing protein [Bacteroidota bacterium]
MMPHGAANKHVPGIISSPAKASTENNLSMSDAFRDTGIEGYLSDPDFRAWVLEPTPAMEAQWKAYQAAHPETAGIVAEARQVLLEVRSHYNKVGLNEAEIEARLAQVRAAAMAPRLQWRPRVWATAAVLLLLALSAAGLWRWLGAQRPAELSFATGYGETREVSLPDGSKVQLNANSRLRFAADWEGVQDRAIWLEGEGYFQIEKQPGPDTRVRVHTPSLTVEVVGTAFNVRAQVEHTRVFLTEGKVTLRDEAGTPAVEMAPGDLVVYEETHPEPWHRGRASPEEETSWTQGIIFFRERPLAEVLDRLGALYGVAFEVPDSLLSRPVTTGLPIEDLSLAQTALEKALGVRILLAPLPEP